MSCKIFLWLSKTALFLFCCTNSLIHHSYPITTNTLHLKDYYCTRTEYEKIRYQFRISQPIRVQNWQYSIVWCDLKDCQGKIYQGVKEACHLTDKNTVVCPLKPQFRNDYFRLQVNNGSVIFVTNKIYHSLAQQCKCPDRNLNWKLESDSTSVSPPYDTASVKIVPEKSQEFTNLVDIPFIVVYGVRGSNKLCKSQFTGFNYELKAMEICKTYQVTASVTTSSFCLIDLHNKTIYIKNAPAVPSTPLVTNCGYYKKEGSLNFNISFGSNVEMATDHFYRIFIAGKVVREGNISRAGYVQEYVSFPNSSLEFLLLNLTSCSQCRHCSSAVFKCYIISPGTSKKSFFLNVWRMLVLLFIVFFLLSLIFMYLKKQRKKDEDAQCNSDQDSNDHKSSKEEPIYAEVEDNGVIEPRLDEQAL